MIVAKGQVNRKTTAQSELKEGYDCAVSNKADINNLLIDMSSFVTELKPFFVKYH